MAEKKRKKAQAEAKAKVAGRRRKKRKRRGNNALYFLLVLFLAVGIGIMLSLTVFFNIEVIEIEGRGRYSQTELVAVSGIDRGTNLFRIQKELVNDNLKAKFPFIERATVKRVFPSTAVIIIEEAVPIGCFVQEDGRYYLLSDRGRVLDIKWEPPPDLYLKVEGVHLEALEICDYIEPGGNESFTAFEYLYAAIGKTQFTDITVLNLSGNKNIEMVYEDRILIKLGSVADLEKKLDFAKYALETEIERNFEGIMDITIAGQLRYRKAEIHPPGYHGELPEEPEPEENPPDIVPEEP